MSVVALEVTGGLTCLVATAVAAWVAWRRLSPDRTHFISEVLALAWDQHDPQCPAPGAAGARVSAFLFGGGALTFIGAATLALADDGSLRAVAAAVTGVLLLAVVCIRLERNADLERASGWTLAHPFVAAVFYLAAAATSIIGLWHAPGPMGLVLITLHLATSTTLVVGALVRAPRAVGDAAWRPWYLPGVRVLLDQRAASETPIEWVRRVQWPATLLVALDLGLTPLGW